MMNEHPNTRRSINAKAVVFFVFFLLVAVCSFFIASHLSNQQEDREQDERYGLVGNLQFKGRVMHTKTYDFAGKTYYMICAQLDYTNIKDCYILNDVCAVKIKDNIATIAGSVYNSDWSPVTYVEFNIGRSKKEKFIFKDGTTDEFELLLPRNGLSEDDLNSCH